jgi:hypothetical protein
MLSKKYRKLRRHRKTKKRGGTHLQSLKSAKQSERKLSKLITENPNITSGVSSTTLPTAIKQAKLAIQKANKNPEDYYAREDAENKIKIADYWANKTHNRMRWRFESNIKPNYEKGHDWYELKPTIQWDFE